MKNILKNSLILLIVFGIICSISSTSIATEINTNLIQPRTVDDNEADDEYGINPISEDIPTEENSDKKDNLSYFGTDDVTIDDEVYGDAFIFTSGNVTINSTVYGNVFVFAPDLTVSKDGEIKSSLFSFSGKTNIIGKVNTNIYAVSEDFTFDKDAKLSYDLFVSAQNLAINGVISRNAYCSTENLTMAESGAIKGNISYTANEDAQIKREAVGGDISFTRNNSNEIKENSTILEIIFDIISYIVLVLILYMIYKLLKAKFVTDSNLFVDNIGKCVLYGAIFLIVTPIIFILTLLLGSIILPNILSGPAFTLFVLMLLIYILLLIIACSTTIIALSIYIVNKYKEKLTINNTLATVLLIALLALVYKLLVLVPTLGLIITLILMILGLGIWVKLALPEKASK